MHVKPLKNWIGNRKNKRICGFQLLLWWWKHYNLEYRMEWTDDERKLSRCVKTPLRYKPKPMTPEHANHNWWHQGMQGTTNDTRACKAQGNGGIVMFVDLSKNINPQAAARYWWEKKIRKTRCTWDWSVHNVEYCGNDQPLKFPWTQCSSVVHQCPKIFPSPP